MILPTIMVPERINARLDYLFPDTPNDCTDKKHFDSFPDKISYQFNSRGFRDCEWPNDLKNAIWVAGDSVVVGTGQAIENTLPVQIQNATGCNTINVGVRGVSNHTTSYVVQEILTNIAPVNLVVFWSFFYRRPKKINYDYLEEERDGIRCSDEFENMRYFLSNFEKIPQQTTTNVIHVFCPEYSMFCTQIVNDIWSNIKDPTWPTEVADLDHLPYEIVQEIFQVHKVYEFFATLTQWNRLKSSMENVIDNIVIKDLARDGYHWGVETNKTVVAEIVKRLK